MSRSLPLIGSAALIVFGLTSPAIGRQTSSYDEGELIRLAPDGSVYADVDSLNRDADTLSKIEILNILEDNPDGYTPFLNTGGGFSPWLIRTEIFDTFNTILANKEHRDDPEIRSRLLTLSKMHPFTNIRASAQLVLSEYPEDQIPPMFHFGQALAGYEDISVKQINDSMEYCAPPSHAKQPDFEIKAEKDAEALMASGLEHVRPNYRFTVPMRYGAISGGYYSIQGIGLSYRKNAAPHETVRLSNANNRYIMNSNTKDTYWLIDGPHHMIGGASISKLVETQDGLERYLHRVLPSTVSQVFELEDNKVFINFVNLDPSQRSGSWDGEVFTPTPVETYNPPIIVYPDGKISLACSSDAIKF